MRVQVKCKLYTFIHVREWRISIRNVLASKGRGSWLHGMHTSVIEVKSAT